MDEKKLIVPQEVPLCGTCSFWEGKRAIDEEARLVVLKEDDEGQCLVEEKPKKALQSFEAQTCAWEDLKNEESPKALNPPQNKIVRFPR